VSPEAGIALAALVVSLGVAIVGWTHARRSDTRVATANAIAAEALELAKSAEARANRLERIPLERRDVAWDQQWIENTCTLTFRNIGTDTAYDVELVVDPAEGGPRQSHRQPTIAPTEPIGLCVEVLVREARQQGAVNYAEGVLFTPTADVRARITWRSESGVPGIQEWPELRL
jgi:hypothetical protein